MKSMTGFGAAEALLLGRRIKVEISSMNSRKGTDLSVNLPRELVCFEAEVREQLQKAVSRGRVSLGVFLKEDARSKTGLGINRKKFHETYRELKSLAGKTELADGITMEFILRLPGVMEDEKPGGRDEKLGVAVLSVLGKALEGFQKSREREGHFLCRELAAKFRQLDKLVAFIESRKDEVLLRHRRNLHRRLQEAGLPVALDDERLLKEIVIFSDRCDTTEEITRLRAHFKETARLLKTPEAIGRNLDFLLQEIGREVNTIGSKANDLEVSRRVVELKTELEKIREQVQNLE